MKHPLISCCSIFECTFPSSTDPANNGLIAGACVAGGLIAVALAVIVVVVVAIVCKLKMETRSECSHQFLC